MDIPTKIGKYTILQKLGEGASGCVLKAEQEVIHRIVALKILFINLTQQNPLIVKRFRREARLASALVHPSIVPIFEIDEYKGMYYYTMQYVEGTPMTEYIKTGELSMETRLEIFIKLCDALALAHSKTIIHRDLKPHNVIITKEMHPVILDFGIAKSLQDEEQMTRAGNILGSAHYMAPEQAGPGDIGTATDVFGLGVMMYEWITGERPFQGANVKDLIIKRIQYGQQPELHAPARMKTIKPEIPDALDNIVFKSIAASPKDRYQTAGELVKALRDFTKQYLGHDQIPSQTPVSKPKIHRRRSYLYPFLLFILILGLMTAGSVAIYRSQEPQVLKIQEIQKQGYEYMQKLIHELQQKFNK